MICTNLAMPRKGRSGMSDLTKRLRSLSSELKSVGLTISNVDHETCLEAADEIDRLRQVNEILNIQNCQLMAREETDRE